MSTKTAQISTVEISSPKDTKTYTNELLRKIDGITQDVSKPYFRNVFKKLAVNNPKNARTFLSIYK